MHACLSLCLLHRWHLAPPLFLIGGATSHFDSYKSQSPGKQDLILVMVITKQTARCYHSKEEEEAIRRMAEKRRQHEMEEGELVDTSQEETQESQAGDS